MTVLPRPQEQLPEVAHEVRGRLLSVRERVAAACERSGRDPESVMIVAVTKTHPPEVARAALAAGLTDLAENHVQGLLAKMAAVGTESTTGRAVRWHLVGRLQRNKVRQVVGRSVLIHTVDRCALAEELSRRAQRVGTVERVLLQINVAGDPTKAGFAPEQALAGIDAVRALPNLRVEGLTTMPPLPPPEADPAELARPHFARLRQLRDEARASWKEVVQLSMGMSADFEAAVEEGATLIRLGTVLFGPRRT